jgi:hypothetical protein
MLQTRGCGHLSSMYYLSPSEMNIVLALAGLLAAFLIYWVYVQPALMSPRIPGPPAYPLVGHILQVPTVKAWKYFERLAHQYGLLLCHIRCSAG